MRKAASCFTLDDVYNATTVFIVVLDRTTGLYREWNGFVLGLGLKFLGYLVMIGGQLSSIFSTKWINCLLGLKLIFCLKLYDTMLISIKWLITNSTSVDHSNISTKYLLTKSLFLVFLIEVLLNFNF